MLDFRNDRLDYGRQLIPPDGYRLDRAIAATYSLDLNTLLSIPVALFYSQTLEGKLDGERFQVLEAIRRTADIVTVYCQERQIHVPDRYNRLFAYMEDMIVQVRMANAFSSFHPKVWVLRYVQDGAREKAFYRVLVLSRNLTYDRSWDLAISLEGCTGATTRSTNRPLTEFLAHLNNIRPFNDFRRFTRELATVKFEIPSGFKRLAFHPVGIDGYRDSPIVNHNADSALCMSPFIDDETVTIVREVVRKDFWLFGRRREMSKLKRETVEACKAYCISDLVVDGENLTDVDDSNDERREQDLHAKLFVFKQEDTCRWFVGSANATRAARTRNTEFMVELVGGDRRTMTNAVEDLLGKDRNSNVFEEFHAELAGKPDLNASQRAAVRQLEYQLALAPLRGSLELAQNRTNYDLTISLDLRAVREAVGLTVAVGPLNCNDLVPAKMGKQNQFSFKNIRETEISRFVVFAISDGEELLRHFVLRYEVEGVPATRNNSIFKSVVSNSDQFFEYLRFLLADEISKGDLFPRPKPPNKKKPRGDEGFVWDAKLPIFESVIAAASRDPVKLKAVDSVIRCLRASEPAEEVLVPPEFLVFWEVFRPLMARADRKDSVNGE